MIFKYLKLKLKRRKLLTESLYQQDEIGREFQRVQEQLGLIMALPQFEVIVEWLEAQIEANRDILELDFDNKESAKARAKIEVYRELIGMFNEKKEYDLGKELEDVDTFAT